MKWVIDPPSGWKYGFPKECPDLLTDGKFNLEQWLIDNGYPEKDAKFGASHYRYWQTDEE